APRGSIRRLQGACRSGVDRTHVQEGRAMHARSHAGIRPRVLILALAMLTTLVVIAPARDAWAVSGPISLTAMGGFYSGGIDEPFLGAGVKVGLGGLSVTPYAEYIFVSNGNAYSLNA